MSSLAPPQQAPATSLASKIGLGSVAVVVLLVGLSGGFIAAAIVALALFGTPLFAIMGGASELAWLFHRDATYHHLRYIAANILTEHDHSRVTLQHDVHGGIESLDHIHIRHGSALLRH